MGNPSFADSGQAWQARSAQGQLFDRAMVKAAFKVDAFFIDLLEPPEFLVTVSRYYFGLFSHQRTTMVWKGMLQVRLEDNGSDAIANILLEQIASVLPPSAPETATPSLFGTEGIDDAS